MIRTSLKYKLALKLLPKTNLERNQLYRELNKLGYFWNSNDKQWIKANDEDVCLSDEIKIRLWCDAENVEKYTKDLRDALRCKGLICTEYSAPYICRPPNHNQSRVYLKFKRIDKELKNE